MVRQLSRQAFFAILLAATGAAAQTVTGSGTSGTVPQFTEASTVGDSPISISGSNVGIGTTSPLSKLHISGSDWNGITLTNSGNSNTVGTLKERPYRSVCIGKEILNSFGRDDQR